MMKTYSFGVAGLVESGYLPGAKAEFWNKLLCAFYTAAVMNLTFGPTFMAFHKCTDRYLELRAEGTKNPDSAESSKRWIGTNSFPSRCSKRFRCFGFPHTL